LLDIKHCKIIGLDECLLFLFYLDIKYEMLISLYMLKLLYNVHLKNEHLMIEKLQILCGIFLKG